MKTTLSRKRTLKRWWRRTDKREIVLIVFYIAYLAGVAYIGGEIGKTLNHFIQKYW